MSKLAIIHFALLMLVVNGLRPQICPMIRSFNYPCEDHGIETPDGFILGVSRIPPQSPGAKVVILQHGLLDSSATFLNNGPRESLGFILHDAGFDVWLGNSRGNTFSENNTQVKIKSEEYWARVDWDFMAKYDMPYFVDYVLALTNKQNLSWVGHSQGTIQAFAALSQDYSNLNSKINYFVALAPVAYVYHMTSIFFEVLAHLDAVGILKLLGYKEFMPNTEILKDLGIACNIIQFGCKMAIFLIASANMNNMNASRFDYYLNYEPAATSVRNMAHWAQGVNSNCFQMFDYGTAGNRKHYGQTTPPKYDLTKVNVKTALFAGGIDTLADMKDVAILQTDLGSNVDLFHFEPAYGHLDFVWGMDAHIKIYPQIVQLLQKHGN